MRRLKHIFTVAFLAMATLIQAERGAAPSMHLGGTFASDAVLKMQKVKITQSRDASFFEVNNYTNGYCGLQQTPDLRFGAPNILIASLWDANTAAGIYAVMEYKDTKTLYERFGGEGDGAKTVNPYKWTINTWYNIVNRSWKSNGRLYVATFINDLSSSKWLHTSTLSIPDPGKYLGSSNGAFLENWTGSNINYDGGYVRQVFLKDCFYLNTSGLWGKYTKVTFSANDSQADITRNGIYHNSFNAYYDATEDAFSMLHGGNTERSAAFNGGRTLTLPNQAGQTATPVLVAGEITNFTASHSAGVTNLNWGINDLKSPQLSAKIEISNATGTVVKTLQDTVPHKRNFSTTTSLMPGSYTAKLTVIDIFNQPMPVVTANFEVTGNAYIISSKSELNLPATENASEIIDITSNINWTATENVDWLTLDKTAGTNNETLTITASANSNKLSRTAVVTLAGNGVISQTITITQSGLKKSFIPEISTINKEVWYYVLNQRGWQSGNPLSTTAMSGTTVGVELTTSSPKYNNYKQQWKVVQLETDKYQLINRATGLSINALCAANSPTENYGWRLQETTKTNGDFPGVRIISSDGTVGLHASGGRVFNYNTEWAECFWVFMKPDSMTFKQPTVPLELSNESNTVWYKIKNANRPDKVYLKAKALGQTIVGSDFSLNNDSLLWKFVDLGDGSVNILNKLNEGQIQIPTANSIAIPLTNIAQSWTLDYLDQEQYHIVGGNFQLHLKGGASRDLVAYPGATVGDASCWIFEKATLSSLNNPAYKNLIIRVENSVLKISGTDEIPTVYSLTGIKVDYTKPLFNGIYIVKFKSMSMKVIILN
ncbi:MAG TPA: DUF3472 domain-containing protein [Paludibacter sp.]|nr:DUF3472 domain-containing protein [Paludibacter sp.]